MAKANKDRRAVVEQMRRDQQRVERRRTILIISACLVVGLVIIGAAAVPLIKQSRLSSRSLADLGVSSGSAGCQDLVKKKASGVQDHQPVGTTIPYPDAPPAFGPHYPEPAAFERKFYTADDRPRVEALVHNLEHGYNMLWYDDTVAENDEQLAAVKAIAAKFSGSKQTDKFIAVPWTSDDGEPFPQGMHVAMTHWSVGGDPANASKAQGIWQYCAAPSGEQVASFVKDYPYSDSPEPNAQ
jgi:hypothetical protein